jgi:hypothetical protein
MKIVITGLPQAGQQELFSALVGTPMDMIRQKPLEAQIGVCEVKDQRITRLSELFKPKKTTYAKIEYTLLPDFMPQSQSQTLVINEFRKADVICWVCHGESAETDMANFQAELIINDLLLAEKRLASIAKEQKKQADDGREREKVLMELCHKTLEAEKPLSTLTLTSEQAKLMRTYQFLTSKPLVVVVNTTADATQETALVEKLRKQLHCPVLAVNAELEAEILQLPANEQAEYLKSLGIDEPALVKMNRLTFEGLGLISFFTVGEDEVRAWPVRRGASAPEAGGAIHTDIAKGFVRAELIKYDDLLNLGSEAKVKEAGKFSLKGKDYVVEDSDILNFRFNV